MPMPAKRKRKVSRSPIRGMAQPELEGDEESVVLPGPAAPAVHRQDEPDRSAGTMAAVGQVAMRLESLRDDSVQRKALIELRWLEDMRNFHGRYDATTEARLTRLRTSRLFVNQTRTKTNSWTARIGDLLFPVDGENWSIAPTPVPLLTRTARMALEDARDAAQMANVAHARGDQAGVQNARAMARDAGAKAQQAAKEMKIAKRAADGMAREIKDQLIECQYNIRSREMIRDACQLGSGVMKGPMAKHRIRRGWRLREGADNVYDLGVREDPRPEFLRVDPWSFFPDMNATDMDSCEFTFERHLPTDRELRRWAEIPRMNLEVLRNMIGGLRYEAVPVYLAMMREITGGGGQSAIDKRHVAWEYHGELTQEEAALLARADGDSATLSEIEQDVLKRYDAIVLFSAGQVLRWSPHPMDSGESLYSVFTFEKDSSCIFGFGVPFLMRDSQAAINGAWRMIMDNSGLAVGPQIIIDRSRVTPQDGTWDIYAKKVWFYNGQGGVNAPDPFMTKDIPIRQTEMQNIITLARQFSDDETSMPPIAYGESASHVTRTAQGMAILMNSVNVTFRRVVRNFDDDVTVRNIRRAYDWNMQFNPKPEIKGDFDVAAKGSAVLLVRELEAQNLATVAAQFAGHPIFGPMTKHAELYRKLIASHMIQPDEIVKTDEELEQEAQQQQANGGPPPSPEEIKSRTQLKLASMTAEKELAIAQVQRETEMMKMAQTMNMNLGKVRAELMKAREKIQSDERIVAAEAAVAARTGVHAGGKV